MTGFIKKLVAAVLLVAVALIGGASVAAADGSSWYAENVVK